MIPSVFHFCYALLPDAKFGFLEYLAIKSALEVNRPERIYLHYQHECSGPWWKKACELVTLRKTEAPTEILGRKLVHFAHRADVLRLSVLKEIGGIYLDIDTICLRPFTDLLGYPCVMAWEGRRGLCNAVILSEPEGRFIGEWLARYDTFRSTGYDKYWDEHSVLLPTRMARDPQLSPHIKMLSNRAFFFPMWKQMRYLFDSRDLYRFRDSYCIHYWESITRKRLEKITPENAVLGESNFARFARRVLQPEHLLENINVHEPSGAWHGMLRLLGLRPTR
jgi:hypothetical protein